MITSISGGIIPTLGHAYVSGDKGKLNAIFDKYELIIYMATFFLFVLGGILITPFVLIYTKGINDANYYQPVLGWIMIMAEFMFCIREPYVNMAYCANKFKEISKYAYIEAIINIVLSIIFVIKFGIIGVAIATFMAMTYRTIAHIFYLKDNILHRSIGKSLKNMIIFLIYLVALFIYMTSFQTAGGGENPPAAGNARQKAPAQRQIPGHRSGERSEREFAWCWRCVRLWAASVFRARCCRC